MTEKGNQYNSNGYKSLGHSSNGHSSNGHSSNGHNPNGHNASGRSVKRLSLRKTLRKYVSMKRVMPLIYIWSAILILKIVGAIFPSVAEGFFTPISVRLQDVLGRATSFIPFVSVFELLIYAAISYVIFSFVVIIRKIIKARKVEEKHIRQVVRFIFRSATFLSCAVLVFYLLWGMNYQRYPLYKTMGYQNGIYSDEQLAKLCEFVTQRSNELADKFEHVGKNRLKDFGSTDALSNAAVSDFNKFLNETEEGLRISFGNSLYAAPPKWMICSLIPSFNFMSFTGITGVYSPYTGESNINRNIPSLSLPFTVAHEMSHRVGIAREDEANFVAFFALRNSEELSNVYSAYFSAYLYCMDALYTRNPALGKEILDLRNENFKADLLAYNSYWIDYEGAVMQISNSVNDAYLEANGEEGIESYGAMVDLLLDDYFHDGHV